MRCLRPVPFALVLLVATVVAHGEDNASKPPIGPQAPAATTATPVTPDADARDCRARRAAIQSLLGDDTVVLVLGRGRAQGSTGLVRSDDFFYVCPFRSPDAAVVTFVDEGVVVHRVYVPPRQAALERWTGPTIGPGDETATRHAFDAARPIAELAPDLLALLATRGRLAVSAASPADGEARRDAILAGLRAAAPDDRPLVVPTAGVAPPDGAVVVLPASPTITALRGVKSAEEVRRVRVAIDATVAGLRDAGRAVAPDVPEFQVQALVELNCRLRGCLSQAFNSIVGSGPNSCILHYDENARTMHAGELVVVDVGGEYRGYAADVTRTFPVSGTFTERQAEIYDAVLDAQKAGIAAVRPGVTLRDVHAAARAVLAERGFAQYFLHGTSHSVGLNVHDPWSGKRALEPGAIVTVEPGVYIAEEALGVRIEDTVLVTEDGCEVLSAGAPKERAALEELMREPPPVALPRVPERR